MLRKKNSMYNVCFARTKKEGLGPKIENKKTRPPSQFLVNCFIDFFLKKLPPYILAAFDLKTHR
jgi:hypothetical protein